MRTAVISVMHGSTDPGLVAAQLARLRATGMDSEDTDVIVLAGEIDSEALRHLPCARIFVCRSEAFTIARYDSGQSIQIICGLWERHRYDALFFTEGVAESELAARVGFRIGGSTVVDVDEFMSSTGKMVVRKGVYSSNLTADFELLRSPYVIGMAKSAGLPEAAPDEDLKAPEMITVGAAPGPPPWLSDVLVESEPEANAFETAKVIVVGGRGVSSREVLARLETLAAALDGVLGASRPMVMNGWIEESRLVGISGRVIHPDLCLAIGVSGSMPFMAGVGRSKTLVAINNDPTASIFRNCDVGVIEDLEPMVEELLAQLESLKSMG